MNDSLITLLTKLTSKVQAIVDAAGGYGGLTTSEIILCTQGMHKGSYHALMTLAGSNRDQFDLLNALSEEFQHHKGYGSRDFLSTMCAMAVHEYADNNLCLSCRGEGAGISCTGEIEECPDCNGSGHQKITGQEKAEALGIEERLYQRSWSMKYEKIYSKILEWANEGATHMIKKLDADE